MHHQADIANKGVVADPGEFGDGEPCGQPSPIQTPIKTDRPESFPPISLPDAATLQGYCRGGVVT